MTRTINAAGLDIIKSDEGLRLRAYRDLAGIWTIGYGHTPAAPGQIIDQAEADRLLRHDVKTASKGVNGAVGGAATTSNQFSAMVSLTFNIGLGGFRASTVLRMHKAQKYLVAADAFLMWNKAHVDGALVPVAGLTRRRSEERLLYMTGDGET